MFTVPWDDAVALNAVRLHQRGSHLGGHRIAESLTDTDQYCEATLTTAYQDFWTLRVVERLIGDCAALPMNKIVG